LVALATAASLAVAGCAKSSTPPRRSASDASGPAETGRAAPRAGHAGHAGARGAPEDRGRQNAQTAPVSHAAFDRLLKKYVEDGRVAYERWQKSAADRQALDRYLGRLAQADPTALGHAAALAFWINAYNASVIRGVLRHVTGDPGYSVSADGFSFFSKRRYEVAGLKLSLNALEHGVLRGAYGHQDVKVLPDAALARVKRYHAGVLAAGQQHVDPRIHFALVCAALGCPPLRAEAYGGPTLEKQLEAQTRAYVNDAKRGASAQGISAIFHWFAQDFQRTHGSVKAFIDKYYRGDASQLAYDKKIHYSWKLNKQD
jgi:hypothetical protein